MLQNLGFPFEAKKCLIIGRQAKGNNLQGHLTGGLPFLLELGQIHGAHGTGTKFFFDSKRADATAQQHNRVPSVGYQRIVSVAEADLPTATDTVQQCITGNTDVILSSFNWFGEWHQICLENSSESVPVAHIFATK
ncbi:MAG: hypothetical protein R3B84_00315 [Zavarzinella sp.]